MNASGTSHLPRRQFGLAAGGAAAKARWQRCTEIIRNWSSLTRM